VSYDSEIRAALRSEWHLGPSEVTVLPSGLMSRTWAVTADGEQFVVRLVDPSARPSLEAGLAAAVHLRARGLTIGEPLRTLAGSLTAETATGALSVLRRVPGRPLAAADPLDQQWWGDRLGAAHRGLAGFDHPGVRRWNWLNPEAPHLALEAWLRPAVADAVAAMTRLTVTDRLTYGVLHGDPAAHGFVVDPASGRTGSLDWGACGTGPLLYDVAAAVVHAGGPEAAADLIDGYLAAGPVGRDELDAGLPVLLRFRWAVQADWCARRLSAAAAPGDRPVDPAPLRDARRALEALTGGCPH
jgi:Ser/Thr protein kinase RdoA (MazF antagonist)